MVISPARLILSSNEVYISPGTSVTLDFASNSSLVRSGFEMQFRSGMQCNLGFEMKTNFAMKFQLLKAKQSHQTEEA